MFYSISIPFLFTIFNIKEGAKATHVKVEIVMRNQICNMNERKYVRKRKL